ncbi:MAG: META domain-containing protein [Pseudomonadales bacterium]
MIRSLLFCLALSLIAGCQSPSPVTNAAAESVPSDMSQLRNTAWQLVEIQSMDDTVYQPMSADEFELQFLAGGELLVKSACNRGRGSWQANGANLQFGPVALTRRACHPESIDGRFNQDLSYVRSFVRRDGKLFLATRADGAILEFRPLTLAPSFACDNAAGEVEDMICSSPGLAALDQKLDALYKKALSQDPDVDRLRAMQRGWIKGRNDCWKASDVHACVSESYAVRITELQVATGATLVPEPVTYQCQSNEPLLTVFYYSGTHKRSAMVNYAGGQRLAFAAPAASGAKYEGRNVMIWAKGSDGRLTWDSQDFSCKQILKKSAADM